MGECLARGKHWILDNKEYHLEEQIAKEAYIVFNSLACPPLLHICFSKGPLRENTQERHARLYII